MTSKHRKTPLVLVLGQPNYHNLFKEHGWETTTKIGELDVDLVCFTGGTDVNPKMYDEAMHISTQNSDHGRDNLEINIYANCIAQGIPMVGICRGAQLLCVMNGGSLIQNITNHSEYHNITTEIGDMNVSSSHHQMMYPWDTEHILLGYSLGLSSTYIGKDKRGYTYDYIFEPHSITDDGSVIEPEVVFFPKSRSIAHQAHPEWMNKESPYTKYFFSTIENYIGIK